MSGPKRSPERLQKILSKAGIASRRASEELIRAGRVIVNGEIATLGQKADPAVDFVKVDGKRVQVPDHHRYLLLNKPAGYMTTNSDPEGRATVFDLLPAHERKGLFSVGRLDFETEGLLLLTDDGNFAQRVSHPRHGCSKTYEVKVRGKPAEAAIEKLQSGIVLEGRRTQPARIAPLKGSRGRRSADANTWWRVEIKEGRTRQVREMFQRIGHPVMRLRRVAIGRLADRKLARGAFRAVTESEVRQLAGTGTASPSPSRKANPTRRKGTARDAPRDSK